jgi:hypothetical protein
MSYEADDEGFTEWRDALDTDEPYYLECENGHGSLPPRRVCPRCGSRDLSEQSLPETGSVETFTAVHIAPPQFVDDVPYVTAIASFGPVQITGVLRGVDHEDVESGLAVTPTVETTETKYEPLVVLRPAD